MKFKRKQKDVLTELAEQKERIKLAKVTAFKDKKLIMNRLGKTVELIVKLENSLNDEGKDDQKVKIRDQLETRGLKLHVITNFSNWKEHLRISSISDARTSLHSSSMHALNVEMKWILVHREILTEAKSML